MPPRKAENEWARAEWTAMMLSEEQRRADDAEREQARRAEVEARAGEHLPGCRACELNPERPHGPWHLVGPQGDSGRNAVLEFLAWARALSRR